MANSLARWQDNHFDWQPSLTLEVPVHPGDRDELPEAQRYADGRKLPALATLDALGARTHPVELFACVARAHAITATSRCPQQRSPAVAFCSQCPSSSVSKAACARDVCGMDAASDITSVERR